MFEIDFETRKSIYAQVVDNIKELIIIGAIRPDQKIPSVRELSKTITVNPNTVQKAYSELERLGYIYTVVGRGTFAQTRNAPFNPDPALIDKYRKEISAQIRELYYLGLEEENISTMLMDLSKHEKELIEKRRSE